MFFLMLFVRMSSNPSLDSQDPLEASSFKKGVTTITSVLALSGKHLRLVFTWLDKKLLSISYEGECFNSTVAQHTIKFTGKVLCSRLQQLTAAKGPRITQLLFYCIA